MSSKFSVSGVLDDATKIIAVWDDHPELVIGTITSGNLKTLTTQITAIEERIEKLRHDLSGLMDQRDDLVANLSSLTTRSKSGVRAAFGPDSPEYAQAGGVRTSERKARKARTPKPKDL